MTTTTPAANQFPLPAGAVNAEEWALGPLERFRRGEPVELRW